MLAIADAAPQHTIAVHLEGGQGGGHHSWEQLDELLLETYHELRVRGNVLLCVGGGVGDPARAAELLCGTWSLVYDEPAMPVDAVLVGTAAMACAEAAASAQVKRALVDADGSEDWVLRGECAGAVTSARSTLDADIHLLATAAAEAAHLLEQVAGDAGAVAARRDEIVAALARTAKPYVGDVEAMSYRELLACFTRHCAIGRGGRYDDGAWGHPTWRARALELYRRFGARLHPLDDGPIARLPVQHGEQLDDPAVALEAFCRAFPAAATTLLHPGDAQFFLEVCDRPGKPVPFVPVLDGEVRRWLMADALWQAQDDRLDVDSVVVIPGPRSVAGITRADEPVAELLARFEAEAIARRAGRRRRAAAARPAGRSGPGSRAAGRCGHRLRRPRRGALRGALPARGRCGRSAAHPAQPAVAGGPAGRRGARGARRARRAGVRRRAAGRGPGRAAARGARAGRRRRGDAADAGARRSAGGARHALAADRRRGVRRGGRRRGRDRLRAQRARRRRARPRTPSPW